jgi:O-antigen/teichoic acid export membrane protein
MQKEVFKRLAKDTTIYGFSTILAKMLNFLLLPVYTRLLSEGNFGIYNEIFAYIAPLQVILVFGMETSVFRFASLSEYDSKKVFSTISGFLSIVAVGAFVLMYAFSQKISTAMGYHSLAIIYAAGIISADCFTSVFFARLRYERKAVKFVVFKTVKIFSEIFFNLVFLFVLPQHFKSSPDSVLLKFFTPEISYVYILAAVFCSALVSIVLFIPEIIRVKYRISMHYFTPIIIYSFPLMLGGLQGTLNDFIDRSFFRHFIHNPEFTWDEQLGVFSANARFATIMSLFVLVFRYAAEPYFFSESSKNNIKPVYARATKYFTIFCVAVFLAINAYSEILQFFLGKGFRSGMTILPVMLFAYMLSGINQNISMWYKLSSKTGMAVFVTFAGLLTTVLINVMLMPFFGYHAAAWGHVASYLIMILLSWNLSKRYYRIPYQWKSIIMYIFYGLLIFGLGKLCKTPSITANTAVNTVLLAVFLFFVWKKERKIMKNEE